MRLILFDIDGTLLSTRGAAKRAFERAMVEAYGTAGPIETHAFDGKTDPQIARELLALAGWRGPEIDAGFVTLWPAYVRHLTVELSQPGHATTVLPGVRELLDSLVAEDGNALLGLLTGNIEQGAALKLGSAGLDGVFRLGAYGSDCEQRHGLPEVAIARARALSGVEFRGHEVVVIGDTPSDVRCGEALGVRAIGVATGRHSAADLLAEGAHAVFDDLCDRAAVLEAMLD